MPLTNPDMVREQFEGLDEDTRALLRAAVADDLRGWSRRLVEAWQDGDAEAVHRARHALRGLTGNFGAVRLMQLAEPDCPGPGTGTIDELAAATEATIAAILEQSR